MFSSVPALGAPAAVVARGCEGRCAGGDGVRAGRRRDERRGAAGGDRAPRHRAARGARALLLAALPQAGLASTPRPVCPRMRIRRAPARGRVSLGELTRREVRTRWEEEEAQAFALFREAAALITEPSVYERRGIETVGGRG